MGSFFQKRRMAGWTEVDHAGYASAYDQLGGSVLSNPMVLKAIEEIVECPIQYYIFEENGKVQAALPVWKKWVAGSKLGLKKMARKGMVDFGNAELILPIAKEFKVDLPVATDNLSALHSDNIHHLKNNDMEICLAKPATLFSKKFRYNRKRERRLLEEAGGCIKTLDDMSSDDIATMYIRLFELRWGFKPTGYERLSDLLGYLRPMLFGSVIEMDGKAIAFQLVYKADNASHISMEYVNGGVDPAYKEFSAGSVLTSINTQQAWAFSEQQGKPLRYSFGKADNEYKDRWCVRSAIYSI